MKNSALNTLMGIRSKGIVTKMYEIIFNLFNFLKLFLN